MKIRRKRGDDEKFGRRDESVLKMINGEEKKRNRKKKWKQKKENEDLEAVI